MKLKETYQTEAYISDGGYYVIRQPDPLGDRDMVVLLSPDQLRAIMPDMKDAIDIERQWWMPITKESP